MTDMSNGVITYRHGFGSLALTVRQGVVVACEPDRHGSWIGLDAADVWHGANHWGVTVEWHEAKDAHVS